MKTVSARWSDCLVVMCDHCRAPDSPRPSCGSHGAEELRTWLKEQLVAQGLWGRARVVTASCLDICPAEGVAISMQGLLGDQSIRVVDPVADRQVLLKEILALIKEA
jgi:predicted metal-binding protein